MQNKLRKASFLGICLFLTISTFNLILLPKTHREETLRLCLINVLSQTDNFDELLQDLRDETNGFESRYTTLLDMNRNVETYLSFNDFPHALLVICFNQITRDVVSYSLQLGENSISLHPKNKILGASPIKTMCFLLITAIIALWISTHKNHRMRFFGQFIFFAVNVCLLINLWSALSSTWLWWL